MEKETLNNLRLGIFVSLGILFLVLGLFFIGNKKNMFSSTIIISSNFNDVSGLIVGNNVRYFGMDIGTVEEIRMYNETSVNVKMIIDEEYRKFIRKSSYCTIGTDGLMGNKLINISSGKDTSELVDDKDILQSRQDINIINLLVSLDSTNNNLAAASSNIRDMTDHISREGNVVNSLVYSKKIDEFLRRTIFNIEKSSIRLNHIMKTSEAMSLEMNHGKGILTALIRDTILVRDLNETISNVRQSSQNLNQSTLDANQLIQKVNTGNGTIALLINDTIMPQDIKRSVANINKSSESIGDILDALKHNFLLKRYFKKLERNKLENCNKVKELEKI